MFCYVGNVVVRDQSNPGSKLPLDTHVDAFIILNKTNRQHLQNIEKQKEIPICIYIFEERQIWMERERYEERV